MMVSVGNVPPLGKKRYPLPLIDFNFFHVNIEQQGCCVNFFGIFLGSFGHFYALIEFFIAFMCIIQILTIHVTPRVLVLMAIGFNGF